MEFKLDFYRRMSGHILTIADGHKYLRRKYTDDALYLKCSEMDVKLRQNWIGTQILLP